MIVVAVSMAIWVAEIGFLVNCEYFLQITKEFIVNLLI